MTALWIMWKTHPPPLWINGCLIGYFVESVEKLSTGFVDNCALSLVYVESVEKLSTAIVHNSTKYSHLYLEPISAVILSAAKNLRPGLFLCHHVDSSLRSE